MPLAGRTARYKQRKLPRNNIVDVDRAQPVDFCQVGSTVQNLASRTASSGQRNEKKVAQESRGAGGWMNEGVERPTASVRPTRLQMADKGVGPTIVVLAAQGQLAEVASAGSDLSYFRRLRLLFRAAMARRSSSSRVW